MSQSTTLLTARDVRGRFGNISKITLYRWLQNDGLGFPTPVRINNALYFDQQEIEAFITSRKAGEVV